jgi:hypothetical protein
VAGSTLNHTNTSASGIVVAGTATISGTLTCGATSIVSGTGNFVLVSGATLGIGSPAGITSSGATGNIQTTTRNFSTDANYIYNGSAAQSTGNGLAGANNLTIADTAGVSLAASTIVSGSLVINPNAALSASGNDLVVAGNWTNNGTFIPGSGSVAFNGTGKQIISGNTTAFNNLILNSGATVIVPTTNTPTVTGTLTNNGVLSQTRSVAASAKDVKFLEIADANGMVKYHGVEITNTASSSMGNVTVQVAGNRDCTSDNTSQPVRRCFSITPTTARTTNIKFWYLQAEANSNTETSVKAYHWNGSGWSLGGTAFTCSSTGGADRWVEVTNVSNYSPFVLDDYASGPTSVTLTSLRAATSGSAWPLAAVLTMSSLLVIGARWRRRE